MFVSQEPDATFRHVVLASAGSPNGARYVTPLTCERVHFAASRGVCLTTDDKSGADAKPIARIFDERFVPLHQLPLTGVPSRTRVSADGRRAAITVFEKGHSYADEGFSTRTTIVDTASGAIVGDLEQFAITKDGAPFSSVDFNFWGVTFTRDGDRFFASLRSRGVVYLVEGSVDRRQADVVMSGVECPSLSRDDGRLAFKKRVGGSRGYWQLSVAELATRAQRPLAGDSRSVDDQVEWVDDSSVMYFLPSTRGNTIWRLRTDAAEAPSVFIENGSSPAFVR